MTNKQGASAEAKQVKAKYSRKPHLRANLRELNRQHVTND
jgi:hypothetical protein